MNTQRKKESVLTREKTAKQPKNPVAPKKDPMPDDPTSSVFYPIRLALILFAITAAVAVMLSVINEYTDNIILEREVEATDAAMRNVLKGWDRYDASLYESAPGDTVSNVYVALDEDNFLLGYCVTVTPTGFGGGIKMMVGFLAGNERNASQFEVSGVEFISMNETPGLGTKVQGAFSENLIGKVSGLKLVKAKAKNTSEIQAVTAATISSKAVVSGINAAANAVMQVELHDSFDYERRSVDAEE